MNFDLRLPIGIMFSVIGVIVAIVGMVSSQNSTVLGININLIWGIVLVAFGVLMLFGAISSRKNLPPK